MTQEPGQTTAADTEWFTHDRFGLFIHWGIYALPARHEWVKKPREDSPTRTTRSYFDHFDPDLYDPETWAREAKDAGMSYFVVTTKHHDGFCLWDSDAHRLQGDQHAAGRDLIAPVRRGVPRRGAEGRLLPLPDRLAPPRVPRRRPPPQARRRGVHRGASTDRDIARYREYLHGQVRELLTRYGRIDIMWFDFSYSDRVWGGKGREDWGSEELMAMVRELQPGIIVNDRLRDRRRPRRPPSSTSRRLARGGRRAGRLGGVPDAERVAGATTATTWTGSRSICSCRCWSTPSPRAATCCSTSGRPRAASSTRGPCERCAASASGCACTSAPSTGCTAERPDPAARLPLHSSAATGSTCTSSPGPSSTSISTGWPGRVEYAQLLNDASEIEMRVIDPDQSAQNTTMGGVPEGTLTLELPVQRPTVEVPVVELFLKG